MLNTKYIFRIIHFLISLFFGLCIIQIYYSFFTYTRSVLLYLALIAVFTEGFVVFILNKGDCPMFAIHKKYGDDKYFFELFFPRKVAKKIIPIVAVITFVGAGLLLMQSLRFL